MTHILLGGGAIALVIAWDWVHSAQAREDRER
jgi:hypothetical protein